MMRYGLKKAEACILDSRIVLTKYIFFYSTGLFIMMKQKIHVKKNKQKQAFKVVG